MTEDKQIDLLQFINPKTANPAVLIRIQKNEERRREIRALNKIIEDAETASMKKRYSNEPYETL